MAVLWPIEDHVEELESTGMATGVQPIPPWASSAAHSVAGDGPLERCSTQPPCSCPSLTPLVSVAFASGILKITRRWQAQT
jgi:hypothetical protein